MHSPEPSTEPMIKTGGGKNPTPASLSAGREPEAFSPDTDGLLYQSPFANNDPVDDTFGAGRGSQLEEAEGEAAGAAAADGPADG